MPTPMISGAFGDLLDPRFQKIFFERFTQLPDMVPQLYTVVPSNNRNNMMWSEVGAFGDWAAFSGTVNYDSVTQGYDTTLTPVEFASGFQVERRLFDDDQYHIMDMRPNALSTSLVRTRQKHAARIFVNGFSVDTFFYNNTEGVSLFSDSHTTNASGVSIAVGFDNKVTSALTATAVAAARIQMVGFRDDRGNRIEVKPDELWYPPDLYGQAREIIESEGQPDSANNNINIHKGGYTGREWNYLSDANDWFMVDSMLRKDMLFWEDRVGAEFAMAEDLDSILAKWRGYARYGGAHINWRWALGAQVS